MGHTIDETMLYIISLTCCVRKGDVPAATLALLIELGFSPSSDGFTYLRKAIHLQYLDQRKRASEIYLEIVAYFGSGTTVQQVEHAILTAIDSAWKSRNAETWEYFFDEKKIGKKKRPGNKEFIAHIACIMELWFSHCQEVSYGIQ